MYRCFQRFQLLFGWLFIFVFFFAAGFVFFWVPDSMLSCCSAFLVFVFPASLLFMLLCFTCFFSFLLLCFPCFSAFLLFAFPALLCFSAFCFSCFSAFHASLLLYFTCFSAFFCFCASVPFYFYYSIFSFLQSCVFAALLPAPLLLCVLSLLPPCFCSSSFALFSPVCILNETLKFKDPKWNPKKPKKNPDDKKPLIWNHKLTLKKT